MKVFISQVMNGKSEEDILAERKTIQIEVTDRAGSKVEFIDSYFEDYNPDTGCVPLKYLSKSLELLADADLAVFGKGWEQARGCVIEHACAVKYGIPVMYVDALDIVGMHPPVNDIFMPAT